MNLCYSGHEEVCFEGRKCPVCEAIADKQQEIDALESKVRDLESTVSDLESQIQTSSE